MQHLQLSIAYFFGPDKLEAVEFQDGFLAGMYAIIRLYGAVTLCQRSDFVDLKMEKKIAQAFIFKNKRERFMFEMAKQGRETFGQLPKSRFNAICRLENIVDPSLSIIQSKSLPSPKQLIEIMSAYGAGEICYVLSEYAEFDGVYVDLRLAAEKLNFNGFPSLIVGLPSGFSHLKFESYASRQPNWFLKPSIRFDNVPWSK